MRDVRLGPFELDAPVGRGGMGEVWRAVHVAQGVPVAVKVLTAEYARRKAFLAAFRNEVRAAVGLDHPHVARVYDLGLVTRDAELGTGGALVAGSPYLVMEYVHGGSLEPRCGQMRWPEVREILLGLLSALGHAHARGVVHRDVKPGNVLLADERDGRQGIRLTDFGLAHADRDDRSDLAEAIAGTPRYMAPEQLEGRWRDQGPWTDLYALGRLALALMMGPLEAPWVPNPVPAGFAGWVTRLLEPRPLDRFQLTADAALALTRLPTELIDDGAALRALIGERPEGAEATIAFDQSGPATVLSQRGQLAEWARELPPDVVPAERRVPPMPADAPEPADVPHLDLSGVGLQVFALRTVPIVGRDRERRQLWDALKQVRADGRPRVVVLHGQAGTGKSRIAQWLAERASEAGAATVLKASHVAGARIGDGLAKLVGRQLGCQGLAPATVRERLQRVLTEQGVDDPYEWQALAEVIAPEHALRRATTMGDGLDRTGSVRFARPEERYVVVARMLKRLSRVRPVLLWLEDAHWSADSLAFAEYLLGALPAVEALVVVTVRDEALAEQKDAASALEALVPKAEAMRIRPLPAEEHAELVRHLLGLDGELAKQVEERTAGNPQFAVQLVRDWVDRGLLVPGKGGFKLRRGAVVDLPANLSAAWQARLDRLLDDLPEEAEVWLERAAVLGEEVTDRDWRRVCDDPEGNYLARTDGFSPRGQAVRARVVERLLAGRLAVEVEGGWAFAHAMLRESLELRARAAGRAPAHHRACARLLRDRDEPGVKLRLGHHLLEAGEPEAAVDAWLLALEEQTDTGDHRGARRLVEELQVVMEAMRLPARDRRWGQLWHQQAILAFLAGDYDAIEPLTIKLEDAAIERGWPDLRIQALTARARPNLGRGRFAEAIGWCEEAVRLGEIHGDRALLGACRVALGTALAHSAEVERSLHVFEAALADFAAAGDPQREGFAWRGMATAYRQLGRHEDAIACFERARDKLSELSIRYAVYECVNGIGDIQRMMGDLSAAEASYREALAGCQQLGSWHAVVLQVNLALTLIGAERYVEAYTLLMERLDEVRFRGLAWMEAVVHAAALPCVAADGDWDAWRRHFDEARERLDATSFADADIAIGVEVAGDLAARAGRFGEAAEAYGLAIAQWRATGRPDRARAVKDRLRALA